MQTGAQPTSIYSFQLTRERGKKEPDAVPFTETSFWPIGKKSLSIFKKKSEEVGQGGGDWDTENRALLTKVRIGTKILSQGESFYGHVSF